MSGRIKAARAGYSGDANYQRAMPGTGYAGDPGLFGFLGKVVKGVAGTALSMVPGPAGTIARRGFQSVFGSKAPSRIQRRMQAMPQVMPRANWAISRAQPRAFRGIEGFQEKKTGVRMTGTEYSPGRGGGCRPREVIEAGPGGACPPGYKPNKTGYWVTSPLGTPSYVEPKERCVKARRRNPLNPRAWDRAYSRLKSAKRWQKKMAGITIREPC